MASLLYLALAARALGPQQFGSFTLVLTYGQLIANLVQFQSWKGVIRYGAEHYAADDQARLARLFGFTASLDWASAVVGLLLAVVGVPLVAPLLHWNAADQHAATLFGGFLLLTTGSTASGMLRIFDRFDLLAYSEATAPIVRLVGAASAWALGGTVDAFLVIWAAAAFAQAAAQWAAALSAHPAKIAIGRRSYREAMRENRRIFRFMVQTNISNSLGLFWVQLGTLAVGGGAGATEAGGFRIAQRISKVIAKPVDPIARALYPEFARLMADGDQLTLRRVSLWVTAVAALLAALVVIAIGFGGGEILRLVAGPGFEFANRFLFLLSIAAGIDLAGFALEPLHITRGRAGRVLRSRAVGVLIYLGLLGFLLPRLGGEGAAIAAVGASLAIFIQLVISADHILRWAPDKGAKDPL